MAKIKTAYFIMVMFQTGNVGSHNIKKITNQPDEGFKTRALAEQYLVNNEEKVNQWHFCNYTIMKLYDYR